MIAFPQRDDLRLEGSTVLRRYPYLSVAGVEWIHAVLRGLAATSFEAPVPVPYFDGSSAGVLDGGRVSDSVFAALQAELTDEQILYLTYITTLYDMHAVMSKALRTEFDNREEPVVEVGGGLLKLSDSERD